MESAELFPPHIIAEAWARASDPQTSHIAAKGVRGERANHLEVVTVNTLKEHGPLTTWEITHKTGINWDSITPRMKPLERKGLIRKTDQRRMSPNGRPCIVYEAL